jgi:spore coat protein U-like protein
MRYAAMKRRAAVAAHLQKRRIPGGQAVRAGAYSHTVLVTVSF